MNRLLTLALLTCAALSAQPACTQITDVLYSVGVPSIAPMQGYIDLNQGYTGTNGAFVVTQSLGRLNIVNGVVNTCQSAGSQLQALYSVQNAGPVAAYTKFTEIWTIPGGAGPYTVAQVLGTRAVSLAWTFGGLLCQATGGAANILVCPGVPAPVRYTPGMVVALRVDAPNTGPTSLNINSLGAISVFQNGAAMTAGSLVPGSGTGNYYQLIFDGTNFNVILGASGPPGVTGATGATGAQGIPV